MKPLVGLFAALVPACAMAQGGVTLKGGVSYGNVSNAGALPGNLDNRTGFVGGVALNSGDLLGLGIEGLYAQRGLDSSTPGDARRLDYIDVPVYLRLTAPTPGITPFAYAGPQASFELSCSANGVSCPETGRPKTTYAGVIGAGVRLGALGGLSLEGRYVYGLTDLKLSTVNSSSSYKTRSFLLLAGIGF
ncbi:MAG TPA: porin family protein [Gemmatimonadaceae bacterium]|nr:porin family protein [Gemmatimonadaceae bacterium]